MPKIVFFNQATRRRSWGRVQSLKAIPITNYFKHKMSNAVTEGNNNILRTVKRFTFNMTNFDHFKARCFAFKM